MGLAERRALKEFREQRYPSFEATIHAAAGFEVPIEIDWDSLAKDDHASSYDEFWTKVYVEPLIDALQAITRDDLGREALAAGLERVVICNTSNNYSPQTGITFDHKVLTIDHDPATNVDDVAERTEHLIRILEQSL